MVFSLRQIRTALAALLLIAVTTPVPAATPEPAVSEAAIVPLFPQKERDPKKGLPPGMTAVSFWAGHGVAKITKLADGKVLTEFDFEGLIPYGVYTLWTNRIRNSAPASIRSSPTAMVGRTKSCCAIPGRARNSY